MHTEWMPPDTTVFGQVQSFLTALRALSHKDFHYGSYATSEQVATMLCVCHEILEICTPHWIF